MKRWLAWLFLAVLLAVAAYVAVAVPLDGRTLLQRVCGEPGAVPADQPADAASGGAPGAAAGASGQEDDLRGSDRLTEEDRRGLDRLIESKLQQEAGGEARPPGPP